MDDYGEGNDGGYGDDGYGGGNVTMPAGTPYTPEVVPSVTMPQMPAEKPALKGLGDLTPAGACSLLALSRVAYRFFQEVATGTTVQSLATLNVYRALFNEKRPTFASSLSPAAQAALPTAITAPEWSPQMRASMALVIAAISDPTAETAAALRSMPPAMSGITAWLEGFRRTLSPTNLTSLRVYVDLATRAGEDPTRALVTQITSDLRVCAAPQGTPMTWRGGPSASGTLSPNPTGSRPTGGSAEGSGSPPAPPAPPASGGTTTSSTPDSPITRTGVGVGAGMGSVLTVGLGAFLLYGLYLAVNDKPGGATLHGAGANLGKFKYPELVAKARKAAIADAKDLKCVASREERAKYSLDENSGPKGEQLAKALVKLEPRDADAIEAVYFGDLEKLLPKVCPRA